MKTLGRRMSRSVKNLFVARGRKKTSRHVHHSFTLRDDPMKIDLEVGSAKPTNNHPRRHSKCPPAVTKTSLDYRPPGYKPSWDPEETCTGCHEKLGLKLMPVLVKNDAGVFENWHHACRLAVLYPESALLQDTSAIEKEDVA